MSFGRRLSAQALLAVATAFALLGTGLQPTDHVHLEGGHVVHHAHGAVAGHSHSNDALAPLHSHSHHHADELARLIVEQNGHHHDSGVEPDHHRDHSEGEGQAPGKPAPRMVWTAVALALAPLLPSPPVPTAIGRAPPADLPIAPALVSLAVPLPRGPPAQISS